MVMTTEGSIEPTDPAIRDPRSKAKSGKAKTVSKGKGSLGSNPSRGRGAVRRGGRGGR